MSATILGLGTAVPEHAIDQGAVAEMVASLCCDTPAQERALPALFRRTTVISRASVLFEKGGQGGRPAFFFPRKEKGDMGPTTGARMAVYARQAGALARQAAAVALERSGVKPQEIDQIVTVSCSGFDAPGIDISLPKALGLSPGVGRSQIGFMGCHGSLNGLRVGRAFCESDRGSTVLVCSVELCSLHLHYGWEPETIVANALFADGAGAVVLGRDPGTSKRTKGRGWKLAASGSTIFPDSEDAMTWKVGDHGFVMTLSARVPQMIEEGLESWASAWLERAGHRLDEIPTWAVHPGGPRIVAAVEKSLRLSRAQSFVSRDVLAKHGNMSSATLFFLLQRLIDANAPLPCVALGFGPGLVVEGALFVDGDLRP